MGVLVAVWISSEAEPIQFSGLSFKQRQQNYHENVNRALGRGRSGYVEIPIGAAWLITTVN